MTPKWILCRLLQSHFVEGELFNAATEMDNLLLNCLSVKAFIESRMQILENCWSSYLGALAQYCSLFRTTMNFIGSQNPEKLEHRIVHKISTSAAKNTE